jgi:hypothetical protein
MPAMAFLPKPRRCGQSILSGVLQGIDRFGDCVGCKGEHRSFGDALSGDHEDEVDDLALGAKDDGLLGEADPWIFGDLLVLSQLVEGGIADTGDELLVGAEVMQTLVKNGLVHAGVGDGVGIEGNGAGGGTLVVTAVATLGVGGGGEGRRDAEGGLHDCRRDEVAKALG